MKSTVKEKEKKNAPLIEKHLIGHYEREKLISLRAYEIWNRRGCTHGYDIDDWLSAENELINEQLLMTSNE